MHIIAKLFSSVLVSVRDIASDASWCCKGKAVECMCHFPASRDGTVGVHHLAWLCSVIRRQSLKETVAGDSGKQSPVTPP